MGFNYCDRAGRGHVAEWSAGWSVGWSSPHEPCVYLIRLTARTIDQVIRSSTSLPADRPRWPAKYRHLDGQYRSRKGNGVTETFIE